MLVCTNCHFPPAPHSKTRVKMVFDVVASWLREISGRRNPLGSGVRQEEHHCNAQDQSREKPAEALACARSPSDLMRHMGTFGVDYECSLPVLHPCQVTLALVPRLRFLASDCRLCVQTHLARVRHRQVARGPGSYKKVGYCVCRRRLRRPRRRLSNSVLMVVGGFSRWWRCCWW